MKVKIGDRLKLLRGQNSQASMAKLMGVSQPCWQSWETNKNAPHISAIHDICTRFNCSSDWLLGLKAKKSAKDSGTLKNDDIGRDCSKCELIKVAFKMAKMKMFVSRR